MTTQFHSNYSIGEKKQWTGTFRESDVIATMSTNVHLIVFKFRNIIQGFIIPVRKQ